MLATAPVIVKKGGLSRAPRYDRRDTVSLRPRVVEGIPAVARMLYANVRFGRGHGFGNRLFPWARARLCCTRTGGRMLAPAWARLAVGPALRGGVDLTNYRQRFMLHGVLRPRYDDVRGLRRWWLLTRGPHLSERDLARAPVDRDVVVRFAGYERYFGPLAGHAAELHAELRRIAAPSVLASVHRMRDVPIAMHVRCGPDFPRHQGTGARLGPGEMTPLSWFVRTLRAIRRAVGSDVPACLFTDGSVSEVRDLAVEPAVLPVRHGSALADLLRLSRARVLLASGSSSFGAWASFLGGMPTASHPGQPMATWSLPTPSPAAHVEFDPDAPDRDFLELVVGALRGSRLAPA
jgi:hypothetical protein